jgi:hypothetical protein
MLHIKFIEKRELSYTCRILKNKQNLEFLDIKLCGIVYSND